MLALSRLRIAMRVDMQLDQNKVARAIRALDELNEFLAEFTRGKAA
jgi:hypothetical protein